ncbi:guanine nucleotide exchange factor DBS-like protein [Labeo rohita]|uniref:Guanine nucleotide exchange factor DBS-like protein n=1 Tax=Labeo rohita TaxID=84645 RepID=A0A498NEM3_LABRO|nr:guanine nucleotide exchange factor DBS-like protein [Labeo rohita]
MAMIWMQTEKAVMQELQRRLSNVAHSIDEIMQKESSPLFAADIITELKKQFAFLSGGRGQDGSPIIIFPEFPSFCEIGDQEFRNVLTYLTSIPSLSAAGVGFIVVIDRRRDRWTCLKGTLLRISGWFPANLRLVLVLRPSAILQRTLSDVFFKLQKDDFKVPVIMLSSLADLHSYIERSQLTQELGGSQYYCHKTWICHRTEEMTGALSQGRKLLENIREPVRRDPDSSLNPDQLENLATVHRLLSQLNESSTAFDEFWIQHQNKLDLCLKLCQFEHNFQQLRKELEQATDTLNAFSDVGISPAQTEHLLQELTSHEKKFCEVLDRVRSVVAEGQCLIENSQNVDENVAVKCSELQRVRESLTQKLKDKRSMLTQAMELHKRLEMPLDKCQSQEGAESALSELECYLETANEKQQWEISTVWLEYENILNNELRGYAAEMDNPSMAPLIPAALQNKKDVLFGNMQEIYNFHKRIFLKELETYTDCPELVGRCFLDWMGELQIYEKYCHNKPRSESLWRQCSDCTFFQECQKKLEHKLGLDSYLLKPVQRITKYQLLLKEMIKYSKGCEGSVELQAALSSILGILKAVNDSMHLIAITGYEGNLGDLGRLLMQGSFSVWAEHKRGHVKVMELARFKPMQRHLFLHQKALLFCKRREESGEGYEKAPSYSFKQELSMAAIGITEHAKGDSKKFEIWSSSRDEVYTVQAASEEVKTIWVTEIRKLLTGQLEACKEASQQKAPEQFSSDTSSSNRLMRNDRSNLRSGGVEKPKTEEERSKELENILEPRTTGRAKGWTKGSLSLDASVEHDGYFSAEEQMTSDPEEEKEDKMCADELQSVRIEEEIQCSEETEDPEK